MILRLIFIVLVLFLVFWMLRNIRKQPASKQKKTYFNVFLWGLVGILIIGFLTGRMHWLGAIAAFVIGLTKLGFRFLPLLGMVKAKAGLSHPTFSSPLLRCTLDTQLLTLSGEILTGGYKGKSLDQLQPSDIQALLQIAQQTDKKAYYLLKVYQQCHQHSSTTQQKSQTHFDDISAPDTHEAEQILGLDKGYSKDDVIKAHKRLIQKLHPDRGGNDYLASRVNLAKTQLLDNLKNH